MILGLDLSLRSTGMVALPLCWSLDWSAVRWATVGESLARDASEAERCRRMRTIADRVVGFAREHDAVAVYLEEQAFSRSGSMAREIAGMTWTVRIALHDAGVSVRLVTASAARKVFLGHARKGAKDAVQEALRAIGAPFAEQSDVADAFVMASFALSEHGGRSVMLGAA